MTWTQVGLATRRQKDGMLNLMVPAISSGRLGRRAKMQPSFSTKAALATITMEEKAAYAHHLFMEIITAQVHVPQLLVQKVQTNAYLSEARSALAGSIKLAIYDAAIETLAQLATLTGKKQNGATKIINTLPDNTLDLAIQQVLLSSYMTSPCVPSPHMLSICVYPHHVCPQVLHLNTVLSEGQTNAFLNNKRVEGKIQELLKRATSKRAVVAFRKRSSKGVDHPENSKPKCPSGDETYGSERTPEELHTLSGKETYGSERTPEELLTLLTHAWGLATSVQLLMLKLKVCASQRRTVLCPPARFPPLLQCLA